MLSMSSISLLLLVVEVAEFATVVASRTTVRTSSADQAISVMTLAAANCKGDDARWACVSNRRQCSVYATAAKTIIVSPMLHCNEDDVNDDVNDDGDDSKDHGSPTMSASNPMHPTPSSATAQAIQMDRLILLL